MSNIELSSKRAFQIFLSTVIVVAVGIVTNYIYDKIFTKMTMIKGYQVAIIVMLIMAFSIIIALIESWINADKELKARFDKFKNTYPNKINWIEPINNQTVLFNQYAEWLRYIEGNFTVEEVKKIAKICKLDNQEKKYLKIKNLT